MYICQLCQVVVPANTPAHRVVIEARPRQYPRRADANPKSRKRKSGRADDPGGTGRETVREITVCPACAARYAVANAKTER